MYIFNFLISLSIYLSSTVSLFLPFYPSSSCIFALFCICIILICTVPSLLFSCIPFPYCEFNIYFTFLPFTDIQSVFRGGAKGALPPPFPDFSGQKPPFVPQNFVGKCRSKCKLNTILQAAISFYVFLSVSLICDIHFPCNFHVCFLHIFLLPGVFFPSSNSAFPLPSGQFDKTFCRTLDYHYSWG